MSGSQNDFQLCVEREFPALTQKTYLDAACIGIAPRRVVRAVSDFAHSVQHCPMESGTAQHGRLNETRAAARPLAARLIGAAPEDIALVESTTHGLSIAAQCLPLEAGDQVLISDLEFIQMGVVWSQLRDRGVGVRALPNDAGTVSVDAVREQLRPGVKVVALSSVQWTNGFRADLAAIGELCRERGVWFVVDAAQHLGALPLNVAETPVDILVCGGHKWLGSPFGAGILYLSAKARSRLRRPIAGFFAARPPARTWGEAFLRTDTTPLRDYEFGDDAQVWEVGGTGNYPGAIALASAISLQLELQPARIAQHIGRLTDQLIDGLDRLGAQVVSPRDPRHRSGIVTFTLGKGRPDTAVMNHLLRSGIAVSVRYTSGVGGIRVSCHHFNRPRDIDRLLDALDDWVHRPHGKAAYIQPAHAKVRAAGNIASQRALIDVLDDDLIGLIRAREQVSRGIWFSHIEGGMPRTDLAREQAVLAHFRDRLGQQGTRLAMELLSLCRGQT